MLYNNLSGYLKLKYGGKIGKICIDGGFSCPNRDGKCSVGGCIFCGERGAGEHIDHTLSIREQVEKGLAIGKKDGYRYEIISQTLEEIPPPPPVVKEGEKEEILRSPKNGVKSEAFLEKYRGKTLLFRKRIRVDEYRPIQGIIVKKIANMTNKIYFNACLFSKEML